MILKEKNFNDNETVICLSSNDDTYGIIEDDKFNSYIEEYE